MGKVIPVRSGGLSPKYNVDYSGDNSDRPAILDLVKWFGYKRSMIVFRALRDTKNWWEFQAREYEVDNTKLYQQLNGLCFSIELGGVSGEPVRALFRRFFGEEIVKGWCKS